MYLFNIFIIFGLFLSVSGHFIKKQNNPINIHKTTKYKSPNRLIEKNNDHDKLINIIRSLSISKDKTRGDKTYMHRHSSKMKSKINIQGLPLFGQKKNHTNKNVSTNKSATNSTNVKNNNGTRFSRKRRYAYEDTYEWEDDNKLLEYDVDEDSTIQRIGRHWKKVAAALCFLGSALILSCICCRLGCTVCWPQMKDACFMMYCPLLDVLKSQYDMWCTDEGEQLEREFRQVAEMLGIKLSLEDFQEIKEHYGFDEGETIRDFSTLRGAAKKWEVEVSGVPVI